MFEITAHSPMLSALHGKRIALVVCCGDERRVLFGVGGYCRLPGEPGCLVIRLDAPHHDCAGRARLVLCEDEWDGQIGGGDEYGCDFCIQLQAVRR